MATRVWTKDEDYAWACVNKDSYEEWEDGWRGMSIAGTTEWWWVQLYTEKGESVVVSFADKMCPINRRSARPQPFVSLMYRSADGQVQLATKMATHESWSCATDTLDIQVDECRFRGDTKTYQINVSGLVGADLAANITIDNPTAPYRPGTGDFRVGPEEDLFYNLTVPVHMGKCSGEIIVNGESRPFTGVCHMEHQWMNFHSDKDIAEWTQTHYPWGEYSYHLYDMTFSDQYENTRIPMLTVMHEERGLLFESLEGDLDLDVLEMVYSEQAGFEIPKKFVYKFANDSVKGEIEVDVLELLDIVSVNELPGGDPLIVRMLEERGEHHRYFRLYVNSVVKVQEKGQPDYVAEPREHAFEIQTVNTQGKFFMVDRSGTTPVSVDSRLKGEVKGGL